ncbi:MAG: hypothetical protein HQK75_08800 [Candidatus Magnetomorum sp.]|nr:hypothetical protein [Candidatus Magnetomorum sp.]
MTFGSVIMLALLIAIIVVGVKVRNNSAKLQEIDEILTAEPDLEKDKAVVA